MRKFILIASLVLVSAAAHAGPSTQMASNEAPAAQSTDVKAEPALQEANKQDVKQDTAKPVKVSATKHEGREAKARRIAAKYGVYW